MDEDQTYINQAEGEVALAEGRFDEALRLLEAASLSDRDEDLIESVAAANVAAGHLDVAAKRYEEVLATPRYGNESQELWFRSHATVGEIYERLGRAERGAAEVRGAREDLEGRRSRPSRAEGCASEAGPPSRLALAPLRRGRLRLRDQML